MRVSRFAAYGGSIALGVALLAGCSSSTQAVSSLPGSVGITPMSAQPNQMHGSSRLAWLKLMAGGKIANPQGPRFWKHMLDQYVKNHGKFHIRENIRRGQATVQAWTANGDFDYLLGTTKKGTLISTINVGANGCSAASTVKVDVSMNQWVACSEQFYSEGYPYVYDNDIPAYQEYSSTSNRVNDFSISGGYNAGPCAADDPILEEQGFFPDGAANATRVFLMQDSSNYKCLFYYETNEFYATGDSGGVYYWPKNGSTGPTFITLWYTRQSVATGYSSNQCNPVCANYYMDIDSSGNIWFDGDFCGLSTTVCGDGIAEITNATTSSEKVTVKMIFTGTGSPECPEGVYVSHRSRSQTLNVTDECQNEMFSYPITSGTLGTPTVYSLPADVFGFSEPLGLGFGAGGKAVMIGDGYGFDTYGSVAHNTWKAVSDIDFIGCCGGATLSPSDRPF